MNSIDPETLSVTHICDGEEVVTGGDDGQQWIATFADATTAELFILFFREQRIYPRAARKAARYHCNVCGGEVDLSNATRPTEKVGVGRKFRQTDAPDDGPMRGVAQESPK